MLSLIPVMNFCALADWPYVIVADSALLIAIATACRRRLSWNSGAAVQWKTSAGPV